MQIWAGYRNIMRFALLLFVALFAACTTIPSKEFASYRDAFANARTAGEQVLLDHGVAVKEHQRNLEEKQAQTPASSKDERPVEFDPEKVLDNDDSDDAIIIRMQAWDVIARYNDVLTGLAEGKSVAQVTAAVDGLFESLSSFPIEAVGSALGPVGPFIGALKVLLAKAEQERARREFINAVEIGAPLIEKNPKKKGSDNLSFLDLLEEDIRDFYRIHKALNDRVFERILDAVADLRDECSTLAKLYKPTDELRAETQEINDLIASVDIEETIEKIQLEDTAAKVYTPIIHSQIVRLKGQIAERVNAAKQKTAELLAYREMLASYVKLLSQMSRSLKELRLAAENTTQTLPPVEDLVSVYIKLRQAIETYRKSQRSST